jgi:hypothetical protein
MNSVADNTTKYVSFLTFEDIFIVSTVQALIIWKLCRIYQNSYNVYQMWNLTRLLQEMMHPPPLSLPCGKPVVHNAL